MATTLKYRFAMRRRSAAEWTSVNEVLLNSEWGYESDTGKLKIGDGVSAWNALGYLDADQIPEGIVNRYFTQQRVAASLVQGPGIDLSVDGQGKTTIAVKASDGGVQLTDWSDASLADWSDEDLEDWTPAETKVLSVFTRVGNVVANAGDYTTDQVLEAASPTNLWFTASRVRSVLLTGLSTATNAAIAATDTVLAALGKLQAQITARQVIGQPVKLPTYTLATLPAAATNQDTLVVCTDTSTGRRVVYSDGTNWLRLDTNTVAS